MDSRRWPSTSRPISGRRTPGITSRPWAAQIYLQTPFGSPAFNRGTQPSINLLFDQTLPLDVGFEYNLGIAGVQNGLGQTKYQFSFQWSFQRQVVRDFDIFFQGFYDESSLPRLIQFRSLRRFQNLAAEATIPTATVVGVGAIWTVNDRLAIFGSYNFRFDPRIPPHHRPDGLRRRDLILGPVPTVRRCPVPTPVKRSQPRLHHLPKVSRARSPRGIAAPDRI